ncbi:DUF998 domain-containing protein [Thermocladium modestius]|nr:DUF998 domain-containing protein [Thermocladium modestius]
MASRLRFAGLAAAALAWVVILASIALNPWFVFVRNAFSDLGGPHANYPWVYNYGLIGVAVLTFLFSAYLLSTSRNKVEAAGASYISVAAVFLALIGVFHEGTYPHVFVSLWFFVQFDLAIMAWSIGAAMAGDRAGWPLFLLGAAAPIPAALLRWPSAATLEAYGVAVIDVFVIAVTLRRPQQAVRTARPL